MFRGCDDGCCYNGGGGGGGPAAVCRRSLETEKDRLVLQRSLIYGKIVGVCDIGFFTLFFNT